MKKFIIIATMLLSVSAFAQGQFIKVDRCSISYEKEKNFLGPVTLKVKDHKIYLSNGDVIKYDNYSSYWYIDGSCCHHHGKCMTSFIPGRNYPSGTLVYKSGKSYDIVDLQNMGTLTIKKVTVHQVSSEFSASIKGDFSYHSFIIGNGSGNIRGSATGGRRTIVNVFFDNGMAATIEASSEPLWLDAEPGMKVEHYRYRDINVYKLQF